MADRFDLPRRGVLVGALAAALTAGCRPLVRSQSDAGTPDPDIAIIKRALAAEDALLSAYAKATHRRHALRKRLAPYVQQHRTHRAKLAARLPQHAGTSSSPTRSPAPKPSPAVRGNRAGLLKAEHAAAGDRVDDAMHASPTLAELLASIGACEAAHATLLPGDWQ